MVSKEFKKAKKLLNKSNLAMHIGSVALAIEALELLLIEKDILKTDELMEKLKIVSQEHYARGEFIPPDEN